MNKKIFLWILAVLCIAVCAVLSLSAVLIFIDGANGADPVYSAEMFRILFLRALLFMIIAAVMTVIGLVLNIKGESSIREDAEYRRNVLLLEDPLPKEAVKEQSLQKKLRIIGFSVSTVCLIPILILLVGSILDDGSFTDKAVLNLLLSILPWIVICFSVLSIVELLREKSLRREVIILSNRTVSGSGHRSKESATGSLSRDRLLTGIRLGLIGLAVLLIITGFFNGSLMDVYRKAIRICTECIGLG